MLQRTNGRMNTAQQHCNRRLQILNVLAKTSDKWELRGDTAGGSHLGPEVERDFPRDAIQISFGANDPTAHLMPSAFKARSDHAQTKGNLVPSG